MAGGKQRLAATVARAVVKSAGLAATVAIEAGLTHASTCLLKAAELAEQAAQLAEEDAVAKKLAEKHAVAKNELRATAQLPPSQPPLLVKAPPRMDVGASGCPQQLPPSQPPLPVKAPPRMVASGCPQNAAAKTAPPSWVPEEEPLPEPALSTNGLPGEALSQESSGLGSPWAGAAPRADGPSELICPTCKMRRPRWGWRKCQWETWRGGSVVCPPVQGYTQCRVCDGELPHKPGFGKVPVGGVAGRGIRRSSTWSFEQACARGGGDMA